MPIIKVFLGKYLWENEFSQSTRSCAPIELSFKKETELMIQTKFYNLAQQIESLEPNKFEFNGIEITFGFKIFHTMFDTKCINGIMHNRSTVTCVICCMTSPNFKKEQPPEINTYALSLGIAPLHCWIRSFEHFLHIAYRLGVLTWSRK